MRLNPRMRKLDFIKTHGLGNDFVIVSELAGEIDADHHELAIRLCDRNFGIGADGLVFVLSSETADYRMRIFNSDGSEAEMCGNAIRCFAKYLFDRGLAGETIAVETLAGVKEIEVSSENGKDAAFTVNMGRPGLDAADFPVTGYEGTVISQPLQVGDREVRITCVSMGVPHTVVFTDSVDEIPLEQIGPEIETHPAFPRKTNVNFVQVLGKDEIKVRVWERGAGATLACGTGACASVVAGSLNNLIDREATVHLPGGDLLIDWRESGDVFMTGPALEVFSGSISI